MEGTWLFACDRERRGQLIAVAAEGPGQDLVGVRFGVGDDALGRTLESAQPTVLGRSPEAELPPAARCGWQIRTGAAAPVFWGGRVRGLIAAGSDDDGRVFGRHELDTLVEMAELAAPALAHADAGRRFGDATFARVEALSLAIELRDGYTFDHTAEVVDLSCRVGEYMGLEGPDLLELEFAARLHDVGKLAVDDAILRKPAPLEVHEWSLLRRHPEFGAAKLAEIPGLEPTAAIVRFHHERWDGAGYPDGLAGEQIPLASRIVAACDAYRAMVEDRPYRDALTKDEARAELLASGGSQFDPTVVEALLALVEGDDT